MSKTHTSNRLEVLCDTLAANILKPKSNLFAKDLIITQSHGMNAWLITELAQRNRVFANFEFQNQDGFFAQMHQLLFGSPLQNNSDSIKYKIYVVLGGAAFRGIFDEVATYYKDNDLRRFQLAAKIADLFDQYQLYRSEMIEGWENGSVCTGNSAEKWQQYLWTELKIESRAKLKAKMIALFDSRKETIRKAFPEISIFGISVFTGFHLDFFNELAKYTRVNFYLSHPTDQSDYKNELLLSYGSKALELAQMIPIEGFVGIENEANTLLADIQNRILHNDTRNEFKPDDSLRINSCFTPVREAECLYNYLLNLFENDRSLKPQDVLVMTTDINKYAPFIKAVFRNAPVKIPFQVSGAASNSDDSIVSALETILKFSEEDLTSEKVISLLEQKRIKQRFGINHCNYIRSMVKKANIRFGRENCAEDDTRYVSWKYGLEKILLGYCMLTDDEYRINEDLTVFPFKDAEGAGAYDLFKLKAFVETLEAVIDEQKEPKALADWKLFLLENVTEQMIFYSDYEKKDREEINAIYRALSFADNQLISDKIPFPIFLEELKKRLFTESRESKSNTGRVTVSSPIPLRGIPYKVICFLGLNIDGFPRKDNFMGFDLLGEEYQRGDRGKKETDKYLFLDTLLAAREKLYLSFIGRSVKENKEIPPSIVVDTLDHYLALDKLIVNHPLHGFSSLYHKDNKKLFTYLYSSTSGQFDSKVPEKVEFPEVTVYAFVNFFENPIDWYFKNVLKIRFEEFNDTLPETELFGMNPLEKWFVKNDLLKLTEDEMESHFHKGVIEGQLPLRSSGRIAFDEIKEEMEAVRKEYLALTQNRTEQNIAIDISVDTTRIIGTIDSVWDDTFIAYSFSSNDKHWVSACLKTLLLAAMGKIRSAAFLDRDGNRLSIAVLGQDEALSKLKLLLHYFQKGTQFPLKYSLKTGKEALNPNATIEKIFKAFKEEANGNIFKSVESNPYVKILFDEDYFGGLDQDALDEIASISGLLNLQH